MNFEFLLVAIGLIFTAFELHQNRKSQYLQIFLDNQERYDRLNEDRKEFYFLYSDKNFNLKKLKEENSDLYRKLIHWEARFFWFNFQEWLEGHARNSIPGYLKKDWDYAIKSSMKNPVHIQVWQEEIRFYDFWGYHGFTKFIDDCIRKRN